MEFKAKQAKIWPQFGFKVIFWSKNQLSLTKFLFHFSRIKSWETMTLFYSYHFWNTSKNLLAQKVWTKKVCWKNNWPRNYQCIVHEFQKLLPVWFMGRPHSSVRPLTINENKCNAAWMCPSQFYIAGPFFFFLSLPGSTIRNQNWILPMDSLLDLLFPKFFWSLINIFEFWCQNFKYMLEKK